MRGEQKKNDTFIDILNWQHKFVAIQIWKLRESKIFRILLKRLATWIENISWFINLTTYDEEFDPGSGWTLAAGLTHASRGVEGACFFETGARVRNAYAIYLIQGNSPEKFGLMPHGIIEWHHFIIKVPTV